MIIGAHALIYTKDAEAYDIKTVRVIKRDGANIKLTNQAEADAALTDLRNASWTVASVTTKERKKNAVPPFITSKLQQASRFPVKKTMMIAQQLYEGIELPGEGSVGLITYMRTDSTRVSEQAITDVREFIGQKFGPDFVPEKPNFYRAKADAQDAHEAIRPTSMQWDPESIRAHLTADQYYLYRLIWNRFVACQMPPAEFDQTTVTISSQTKDGKAIFRACGCISTAPRRVRSWPPRGHFQSCGHRRSAMSTP